MSIENITTDPHGIWLYTYICITSVLEAITMVVLYVFPPPPQELARVSQVLEVRESRMVDMSRENITLTEANQTLKR